MARHSGDVRQQPAERATVNLLRGAGRALGDWVGEVVLALLACATFAAVVAAAAWTLRRSPGWTLTAGVVVTGVLGYGAWNLLPSRRGRSRRPWAVAAVALLVVVGVWLSLVVTYCDCL